MGKASRDKGKAAEREVAELLRNLGFATARRGRQYAGHPDAPDVLGIPGAHIEVKRREAGNVAKWLDQAANDAGCNQVPLVFHRRSREVWHVTLYAGDLWRLFLALREVRNATLESAADAMENTDDAA